MRNMECFLTELQPYLVESTTLTGREQAIDHIILAGQLERLLWTITEGKISSVDYALSLY